MEITAWQFYWKDWWKLYPWYSQHYDPDFDVYDWYGGFGPLQLRGYRMNG
jgi:hypothetical protein